MKTHYEVLDVSPSATSQQIRDAYWNLARKVHPDHGGDAEAFAEITKAHATLTNTGLRAQYDDYLNLTMERCPRCSGSGLVYSIRGNESKCNTCLGRGYL